MRRFFPIVIAFLAALPAAAPAQPPQGEPEAGVVVASRDGVELLVRDGEDEGDLCITVRSDEGRSTGCGRARLGRFGGDVQDVSSNGRQYVAGVVPAEGTATVELELADGRRVPSPLVAGEAYTGRYAGRLRFFVVETTGPAKEVSPVLARRFDGAGTLVGAVAAEGAFISTGATVRLLRRGGVAVSAQAQRAFAPSPIRLDRITRGFCVRVRIARSSTATCAEDAPFTALSVQPERVCGNGRTVLAGYATARVTEVVVVLGSGRRITVPTRAIGTITTAHRAIAALMPRGAALRSLTALAADGSVVAEQPLGTAPGGGPCREGRFLGGGFPPPVRVGDSPPAAPEGQQVALRDASGSTLVVRDEGDFLCVGVDRLAADRRDCTLPPVEETFGEVEPPRTSPDTVIGGMVTKAAASVRVQIDGGRKVTVPASDAPGYTGRYAGHVRFFLVHVPGRHRITAVETLDAAGAVVTAVPGPNFPLARPRVVRRGRGYRIFAARYDFNFRLPGFEAEERERGTCFGIAFAGQDAAEQDCRALDDQIVYGRVACTPRLAIMIGRRTRTLRGVELTLAGGRKLTSRALRHAGPRAWVVEIPAGARVTRLRFVGPRPRSRFRPRQKQAGRYPLAPPRAQCGYEMPEPAF